MKLYKQFSPPKCLSVNKQPNNNNKRTKQTKLCQPDEMDWTKIMFYMKTNNQ